MFIWQKGLNRVQKRFLSRPKKLGGGVSLLILKQYYLAAQLRTISAYLLSPRREGWLQTEEFYVSLLNIKELTWDKVSSRPQSWLQNPFLGLTLKLWDRHRTKLTSCPPSASYFTR